MFSHAFLTTNREKSVLVSPYQIPGSCPPVLTNSSEAWTLLADIRRLEAFHVKCQVQITNILWQDHVTMFPSRLSFGAPAPYVPFGISR